MGRLSRFVSAQMLVQVLGFAGGLLLVRSMVQTDYGHYTLAISLVFCRRVRASTTTGASPTATT